MGNAQSQGNRQPFRPTRTGSGPLFGGHHPGDFSFARTAPVDCSRSLPEPPRGVRFGHQPPAWEFHRDAPTWDNTANTRYCAPPQVSQHIPSGNYQGQGPGQGQGQGMRVMNQ